MALVVKHTITHSSGRISYRRIYPEKLRRFVPGGKSEHKISLGRIGSPGLMGRYDAAANDYALTVATAQRRLSGEFDPLDAPMIAYLAKLFEVEWHQREERELEARGEEWADQERKGWLEMLDEYRQWRVEQDLDAMADWWGKAARELTTSRALVLDPNDGEGFRRLCRAMNDVAIVISKESKARLRGEVIPIPSEPERPHQDTTRRPHVPILATFEAYAKDMTPGVRNEWRRYVELLVEFVGHDDAAKLTAERLMEWRDKLLAEPTKRGTPRDPATVRDKWWVQRVAATHSANISAGV